MHLDSSLQLNRLVVRIGDNIEIKCDISGPQTNIVWKRFGYDLSLVNNSTDDDDDEIKLMQDGGLYITNVQMRHSGNYTCQAAVDPQVIQTHIVTVHMQPTIVITPRMQSRKPGEAVEILCHVVGGMIGNIEWLKNDRPLEPEDGGKYTIVGNGTSLVINRLTYADTGSYTCIAGTVKSQVATVVVQNDPTPISLHKDQKVFVFHDDGIFIYSTNLCRLVHRINPLDTILGTDETVCHRYAQKCSWGTVIGIQGTDGSDGLIYIAQPMMDRILVLSMLQHIVLETIRTDPTPMELFHVPTHDQLWVVNYNLHRDGTIKADPAKSLQMIPDVRIAHVKHRAVHPESMTGEIMQLYVPPVNVLPHLYDYRFGFVTHHQQRGFWKLDLELMRYSRYVDLSIYDCIPERIQFGGLCEFFFVYLTQKIYLFLFFVKFKMASWSFPVWRQQPTTRPVKLSWTP
jgi:follistatin-related protein 5